LPTGLTTDIRLESIRRGLAVPNRQNTQTNLRPLTSLRFAVAFMILLHHTQGLFPWGEFAHLGVYLQGVNFFRSVGLYPDACLFSAPDRHRAVPAGPGCATLAGSSVSIGTQT
jgi:hypothetical protein